MSTSSSTTRPTEQGGEPSRIASYLSLGVTGALMATATGEAAIVTIDLTNVNGNNITGANGGVANSNVLPIANWLGVGTGTVYLFNGTSLLNGLHGSSGLGFSVNPGMYATPRNFGAGATIDGSALFSGTGATTAFKYGINISPNFGAGSFMGFRFGSAGNYNYGFLEVTWNSSTTTFQILSGAYESTVNTAIATPSAVPGAGLSAMALMALGGGAFRRRSRDRVA